MYLEDSNGRTYESPTPAIIHDTLAQIGGSLDHCILYLTDGSFVQTAGAAGRLLVQYSESDVLFESARADFDVATVGRIFSDAMEGREGWKTEFEFRPVDNAGVGDAGPNQVQSGGSLKDQILGSVRQQAGREISSGVGRMARRAIRKLLGGR